MMSLREIKKSFESPTYDIQKLLLFNSSRSLSDLQNIIRDYFITLTGDLKDVVSSDLGSYVTIVNNILNFKGYFKFLNSLNHLQNAVSLYKQKLEQVSIQLDNYLKIKEEICLEKIEIYNSNRALECAEVIEKLVKRAKNERKVNLDYFNRSINLYTLMDLYLNDIENKNERLLTFIRIRTNDLIAMFDDYFRTLHLDCNLDDIVDSIFLYKQLGQEPKCEQLIRTCFIKPKLRQLFLSKDLDCETILRVVLHDVLKFLKHISPFIQIITSDYIKDCNMHPYNILLNSIWIEIDDQLTISLRPFYSAADTKRFKNNYDIFNKFYDEFEQHFKSECQYAEYKRHPSYRQNNNFNFEIYFQIINQECYHIFDSRLNNLLSVFMLRNDYENNSKFQLRPTLIFYNYFNTCFDSDYLILQLFPKFWKLALKLISRFILWIQMVLPKIQEVHSLKESDFFPIVLLYMQLLHDIDSIQSILCHIFVQDSHIDLARKLSPDVIDICNESLNEPIDLMTAYKIKLKSILINFICEQINLNLKSMTQIPRYYRKTNKEFFNTPSEYVQKISSLFNTLCKTSNHVLSSLLFYEVFDGVLYSICDELSRLILEIVNSVHKTESSIRRLRRSKNKEHNNSTSISTSIESGSNFKNENATDDDKIFMQLKVDILSIHHNIQINFCERDTKIDDAIISLISELKS